LSLRNADGGVTRTVTSESDGRYVFPALLPGRYVLRTELSGFAAQEVRDAVITIGLELRRDFTLKLQAVAETVTVSADAPVVDTTKAEVGRTDALCELRRHDGVAAVNAWRAQNGLAAISEPQIDSSRINIMDARVSKAFTFGGRKVEVLAQAFGSSHSGSGTRLMRIVSPPAPRRATCDVPRVLSIAPTARSCPNDASHQRAIIRREIRGLFAGGLVVWRVGGSAEKQSAPVG
ncbi:MAG: hypothetical protein DMG01_08655, partial [Acidobacteria bacterium]